MTVATMPNVREREDTLHAIENALDKDRMKAAFAAQLKQRFKNNLEIIGFQLEIIQRHTYRCVVRYRVEAFDSHRMEKMEWRVIGKVLKAELGEILFDNMQQLWMNGFSRSAADGICIPEPLEFIPSLSILLQEEVPGLSVKALLKQSAGQRHFRQLARALAKLHKCPIIPSRIFRVKEHLLRCHPSHEFLALSCPELARPISDLVAQAYEVEASLGDIELAPVHADFHLGQVHLENDKAWLIDFDVLSYGDPATDLGNLLVFLKSKARTNAAIDGLIQTFLEEYFSTMDRSIAVRIPLYESLSYLRRACKSFRLQEEGWRQKTEELLEQGLAAVGLMTSQNRRENRHRFSNHDAETEWINDEVRGS